MTSPGSVTDVGRAVLLFLGAAVCCAVGTVLVEAVTSHPEAVPLPPALLLAFCYGSVPLLLLGRTDGHPVRWTPLLALSVVYTGVVSLAGGYLLQFALLERGDAGVVSRYIFAVPVLTAVYGVVLLRAVVGRPRGGSSRGGRRHPARHLPGPPARARGRYLALAAP